MIRVWRITAADSERDQRRAAAALRGLGLHHGDRVALILPNSPALLAVILGALRTGVVPVLLHPGLLPAERSVLLDDADPQLVVDDEAGLTALLDRPHNHGAWPELSDVPLARPMHYTSGTSGRPKGVWSGVLDEADARALFDDEAGIWRFTPDDTTLICSPLYHSAAVRFSATTLLSGGSVVLVERFDANTVGQAMAEHGPTAAFMVPAHLQRLFALASQPALDSFRLVVHAGAPCPEPLKRRAIEAFPAGSVWEFYGSTEGQFTVCPPQDWLAHPGTVGQARPQRSLEIDADGQVWCRAPAFARFSYWRDPHKTASAWNADGTAFTVGDVGRLDDAGFLYLDGRRDDLVISGGVNVYPAEVEQAIAALPGVAEVAVFGVPDERWGQRVCAAVVIDPAASPVVTADDVRLHARSTLATYKCPKDVYVVGPDDLPRTITGKVRRTAVAQRLGLG
ncbi:MAG: long-chain acyl-CoA synthetase [Acidimicrobiaceae bacterium]|nr:long-chain acyl-CoA synthetase [Acidimicrobiaceae bacterium]